MFPWQLSEPYDSRAAWGLFRLAQRNTACTRCNAKEKNYGINAAPPARQSNEKIPLKDARSETWQGETI